MASPTARTLAHARKLGYEAQVVEKWVAQARRRIDFAGCIDVIAYGVPDVTLRAILGIQACADGGGSGMAAHRQKALAEPRLRTWLLAGGRFEIWAWGLKGAQGKRKTYTLRREAITLADLHILLCPRCGGDRWRRVYHPLPAYTTPGDPLASHPLPYTDICDRCGAPRETPRPPAPALPC